MNGKTFININSISLAAAFVLALSPSPGVCADKDALINVTAGSNSDDSGPAFLHFAKEQQAQKSSEPVKPVEQKNNITRNTDNKISNKSSEASRQAAIIAQKDKTIRQLQQQLAARPATTEVASDNQKELTEKIEQLEKKLAVALAEKQQLINKELSAVAEIKKSSGQLNATANKIQQQENKLESVESAKQKLELQLAQVSSEKETLIKKLAAEEKEKQALAEKLATSVPEKQTSTTKLAAAQQTLQTRLNASEETQKSLLAKLTAADTTQQALQTKLNASEEAQKALEAKLTAADTTQQTLQTKLSASEEAQNALEAKLTAADTTQQTLQTKLSASEEAQKALEAKLTASLSEKQALSVQLAAAEVTQKALTAKLDFYSINKEQSALQADAVRQKAESDKAQLLANAEEIKQLKAKLSTAETKTVNKHTDIDLAKEPQQQAYSVGVSMGEEALKVLSTRSSQGISINKDTVLQGILDSFSGNILLDEKVRNKALFDVSKEVFQRLNKVEKQMVSEGKKYQQKFAKQKGVVFKDGVYSRIDYAGEGRILDSDTVTVTIKETLIDGTIINDMEAEGKVWSQTLKSYPPIFFGPIKRLGNHGSITVVIPPDLAYGSEGRPPKIPPGATMIYSVRIVDATAAEPQAKKP
ncbi:FKBP-type peptidyl-prolyl cis-trans isomerase N-terminal domain-containing protein [Klebsiella huaxiensis]|uniref:peptidylprolyl isomerase n=1 Tax=Klebsiella huaxiensis TaxID=2153354 RepID=A0A564H5S6_9ENTR|nr:FKBP-type peptidyl-prolyl cis-trans isomerase N-terminal domain-containing protein [Klebsiella huaxiensis]VUS27974.1 FKBP-type peptidyl-prolyl cis-trans isomerase FkpA [Klebsiella huaxiensis]